ncbi:unnamed protein product [Aphis gossypii]|uniref:Uncharacterized protein n=1 Tax=Aphis gossypii TaxID=80765 RepID=A0A9P0NBV7_APHGO|nr:unnamed protein product [Aphis gossypii]
MTVPLSFYVFPAKVRTDDSCTAISCPLPVNHRCPFAVISDHSSVQLRPFDTRVPIVSTNFVLFLCVSATRQHLYLADCLNYSGHGRCKIVSFCLFRKIIFIWFYLLTVFRWLSLIFHNFNINRFSYN